MPRSLDVTLTYISAGGLKIDGLRTFATLIGLGFKRNAHALVERANSGTFHGGDVDEYVLAALVWSYEAEAFGLVKKLHCSGLPHAMLLKSSKVFQ